MCLCDFISQFPYFINLFIHCVQFIGLFVSVFFFCCCFCLLTPLASHPYQAGWSQWWGKPPATSSLTSLHPLPFLTTPGAILDHPVKTHHPPPEPGKKQCVCWRFLNNNKSGLLVASSWVTARPQHMDSLTRSPLFPRLFTPKHSTNQSFVSSFNDDKGFLMDVEVSIVRGLVSTPFLIELAH